VFTVIFAIAAVFGIADVNLFWAVREPPMPVHEGPPWQMRHVLLEPLRNRPFRGYLAYAFSESFTFGIAGAFFMLMALEFLKIDNLRSALYVSVIPMIFTAVALPLWGGVCERFGAKPLAMVGMVASIIYPLAYLLATPGHYFWYLAAAGVIGGSFGAAIQTADMSMMYSLTPRESRSAYIACLMIASSLGWAIAPALSGAAAQVLKPVALHVGGLTLGSLHFLMLASVVARLLHSAFIIPLLPEEKPRPTRELVRHLAYCPFQRLAAGFTHLITEARELSLARAIAPPAEKAGAGRTPENRASEPRGEDETAE
jgi:MFS family permease